MSNEFKDYKKDLLMTLLIKMREVEWLYDGWRESFVPDLINELCDTLGSYVEYFEVYQIKEKYGSLTIYWGWADHDYTDDECNDLNNLYDEVNHVIEKYRKISERTCVKCGGKATFLSSHWVIPWCTACRDVKMGVFAFIEDN